MNNFKIKRKSTEVVELTDEVIYDENIVKPVSANYTITDNKFVSINFSLPFGVLSIKDFESLMFMKQSIDTVIESLKTSETTKNNK